MGYTVQVGAFANLDNAVRLMQRLEDMGLDAYYFRHEGLFRVRFGDYADRESAQKAVQALVEAGIADSFWIVSPDAFAVHRESAIGLRADIVKTAESFLGVPYRWSGTSRYTGFDCSGLSMTVYRLNGLNLPRNSALQYQAGRPVAQNAIQPGDLVFFATQGRGRVNHVGIYIGNGQMIHAASGGGKVQRNRIATAYFKKYFMGARSYL